VAQARELMRRSVAALVAASIALAQTAPALAAGQTLSKAEYEGCQSANEQAFKTAIGEITEGALKRSMAAFDYKAAVNDGWRATGMDEIVDKRVDTAVAEVASETSWSEKLKSLAYKDVSTQIATKVAERVYRSEAVRGGIEAVATGVGKQLGQNLEFASQDAAGPAIACVKAFLASRYGGAVSGAVSARAEREFNIDEKKGAASVSAGSVLSQSGDGIAGAAILLVRRQLANMAERIGARIAGSVLSRLVSVAAGGVGAVLIAKDLWDLSSGVLPIIAAEMKAPATKEQVKAELARSISEQMSEHVKDVAAKTSERILAIWQEFRSAHLKTLEIAEHDGAFRAFLDGAAAANLPRLDEVVGLVLGSEGGEAAVLKRLNDGSLNQAVTTAPAQAIDIARETRSLETGLKWAAISGDLLPQVQDYELHRRAKPDDFTKASLSRLIALDDRLAISRLAGVSREARETLFDLDAASLKSLARALSEEELSTLSRYLTGLEKGPREIVLKTVAASPARMQVLAPAWVRDAVLASKDQSAAVDMLLRVGGDTPGEITGDVRLAIDGRVNPALIWQRHPMVSIMSLLPVLVVFLLLRRIFRTRPRPKSPPPGPAAV